MMKTCPICGGTRESCNKPSPLNPHDLCRECYYHKRVFKIALRCESCGKLRIVNRGNYPDYEHYYCKKCSFSQNGGDRIKKLHKARRESASHRCLTDRGYVKIYSPGHRLQGADGWVKEHFLVADSIVGEVFQPSKGHVIHHVDGNPQNNVPNNLVLCESQGYHQLIHKRARAFYACGDPLKHKCQVCQGYSNPEDLVRKGHNTFHEACYRQRMKDLYQVKLQKKRDSAKGDSREPFIQGEFTSNQPSPPQPSCG